MIFSPDANTSLLVKRNHSWITGQLLATVALSENIGTTDKIDNSDVSNTRNSKKSVVNGKDFSVRLQ